MFIVYKIKIPKLAQQKLVFFTYCVCHYLFYFYENWKNNELHWNTFLKTNQTVKSKHFFVTKNNALVVFFFNSQLILQKFCRMHGLKNKIKRQIFIQLNGKLFFLNYKKNLRKLCSVVKIFFFFLFVI